MQKRPDKLDLATIKTPCPKTWEDLTGDEAKRFCSQCEREVHNLSALTRQEGNELLTQANSRLCVRIDQDHEGKVLTREMLVPPSLFNRLLSHFVLAGLSLVSVVIPAQAAQALGISPVIAQCKTKVATNKRRKTRKLSYARTTIGIIQMEPRHISYPKPVLVTSESSTPLAPTVELETPPPPQPKPKNN